MEKNEYLKGSGLLLMTVAITVWERVPPLAIGIFIFGLWTMVVGIKDNFGED